MRLLLRVFAFILVIPVTISFWFFARFTVDDAFISWRYGKNLVDAGVWNYNPANFDMTQAYTNPIYAVLSIVPNALNIDVVLFFKLISLLLLGVFLYWYGQKLVDDSTIHHHSPVGKDSAVVLLMLFLALPATFIHLFSGLETFLFVALLVALLISLYESRFMPSILLSLLLMFTRPEAWLLAGLIPFFFLATPLDQVVQHKHTYTPWRDRIKIVSWDWRRGLGALGLLGIPLVMYFAFHQAQFDSLLPNTFYVKSGSVFSFDRFVRFLMLTLPLLFLLLDRKIRLFVFCVAFFGAVIISYSTSSLTMNYVERFSYHIFAPVFLFSIFLMLRNQHRSYEIATQVIRDGSQKLSVRPKVYVPLVLGVLLLVLYTAFASLTLNPVSLAVRSNYYPRLLDSNAALGKTLRSIAEADADINSFSFGDAGVAAYHSELLALDNVGLGSTYAAREGLDASLLDRYAPDFVVFHSNPDGISLNSHNQQTVFDWAEANGMAMVCEVYRKPTYILRVYAHDADYPQLQNLCDTSIAKNNIWDNAYFYRYGFTPPWSYWRE